MDQCGLLSKVIKVLSFIELFLMDGKVKKETSNIGKSDQLLYWFVGLKIAILTSLIRVIQAKEVKNLVMLKLRDPCKYFYKLFFKSAAHIVR